LRFHLHADDPSQWLRQSAVDAFPVEAGWVADLLRSGGLAKSTSKRYLSVFISFVNWYVVYGLVLMGGLPMEWADETVWLIWLAWMGKFYAFSSIRTAIFGISHHYGLKFGFNPFKSNKNGQPLHYTRFHRALKQVKRDKVSRGRPPKYSLTKFELLKLKQQFDLSKWDDILIWAILTVGVSCLLRWSEITLVNSDYDKLLRRGDYACEGSRNSLFLRDTKTKMFGDSMTVTFSTDGSEVCPKTALKNWLDLRPSTSQWLFCRKDGKPVKATWVQGILKEKLSSIGCSSDNLMSGISLRKGGALTMALCGVPDRVIQVYGRWKSNAYRVYITMTQHEKSFWRSMVTSQVLKGKPSLKYSYAQLEERVLSC
jgi:hypothetical protein